jgi:hypothetical protein
MMISSLAGGASSERIGNKDDENKRKASLYLLSIGTTI